VISRRTQLQVAAFVLVALVGVSYVGFGYAGLDRLFGGSGMAVTVRLSSTGGLFPAGEVTYRGVQVGRIHRIYLTADGVAAELRIADDAPPIPVDTTAVVANRSAVGEQFLDLRPNDEAGPYLHDGSVIAQEKTSLPLPVEQILSDVDSLVASVPLDSLRTVVDEAGKAFADTGPDLRQLLDSAGEFTEAARDHLPQTTQLITDARTVLGAQVDNADAITSLSSDLALLAEQFRDSDADLRALIAAVPPVAQQTTALFQESGDGLGLVFGNLVVPSVIFESRTDAVEQLLATFPRAVDEAGSAIGPDGANLSVVTDFLLPKPCVTGYGGTTYRPGTDTSPAPPNTGAACTLPYGHPSSVRGSQNAPAGAAVPMLTDLEELLGVDVLRGER
jgi:phospholipid/cholesterol/gamma-HCH transport system substrate-binding protein